MNNDTRLSARTCGCDPREGYLCALHSKSLVEAEETMRTYYRNGNTWPRGGPITALMVQDLVDIVRFVFTKPV